MESKDKKQTFVDLYNEMSDDIFRFCYLRVSDRDIALDIMQNTFMKFWDFYIKKDVENPRALLFRIARNLVIDHYKKKKTDRFSEEDDIENNILFSENLVEVNAEAKFVINSINKLEPKYRECVYLRLVEEVGPKDIAKILNQTENNISVRINRGIKMLKEILDGK